MRVLPLICPLVCLMKGMIMSKGFFIASCSAVFAVSAGVASADVLDLNLKFGGGCVPTNVGGTCVLRVHAEGTDLDTEGVQLYYRTQKMSSFKRYSNRIYPLSATGYARLSIANRSNTCYQVRTAPNGNEKPDVRSNVVCE